MDEPTSTKEPAEPAKPRYAKGDRAAIVSGKESIGTRGEIFWIGPNKFGPGTRYGLRGDDGRTHWVDEANLGAEEGAPPAPERTARPVLEKGTTVKITAGRDGVGVTGEVFWVGESKFGVGMRYGVRGDGEASHWVDEADLEVVANGDEDGAEKPTRERPGANRAAVAGRGTDRGRAAAGSRTQDARPLADDFAAEHPAPVPMAADDGGWPSDADYVDAGIDEAFDDEIPF